MAPIPAEFSKTVDIQDIRQEAPKFVLLDSLDKIAEKYERKDLINKPGKVKELITEITKYFYEEERKRLNNEKGDNPVRVVQSMRDGWGDFYGLGFGIEIAYQDGEYKSEVGIENFWKEANPIKKLSDGIYYEPKFYSHKEEKNVDPKNRLTENSYREIILCTARVTSSDLFRNMDIPESIKVDIMEGIYQNMGEGSEN